MTSEAIDLLDLLSVGAIKQAAQDKDRPFERSPLRHFKADIPKQDIEVTTRRPAGSNFDQTGLYLTVNVTEVLNSGSQAVSLGEYQLWIRMPGKRRDGSNPKVEDNSEYSRTLLAANESDASITNFRQIPGHNNVEFKEETFGYKYDRNTNQKGDDGRDIWERGVDGTTFFYRMNFRGGSASNGAKPIASEPTEAGLTALVTLVASKPEGWDETAFALAASKEAAVKADTLLMGQVADGKWIADPRIAGKVLRDGKVLVAV